MAGFFDPTDPTAGGMMSGFAPSQGMPGVMGMLANPQTAGLLGMAGGLLQSAGPSRLPVTNGMAMGAGLQGMQQGIGNAIQNQRGMMLMRALGNAMGPSDSTGQPAPQSQPMPAVTGGANSGPMSGLMAGMGNAAPTPQAAASSAQGAYPASDPQSVLAQYYQKLNAYALAGLPTTGIETEMKYDPRLAYSMPTPDMVNAAAAYGQGSPEAQNALRAILTKNGTIIGRAGGFASGPNGTTWFPNVPQGGMPVIQNGVPTGAVVAQPGAAGVIQSTAAAQAGGRSQFDLADVWDPNANGGKGGVVRQTVFNAANAANGGNGPSLPAPVPGYSPFQNAIRAAESGGNAAAANPASSAQGSMQVVNATAGNPGFGVRPAQNNSIQERDRVGADYASALHAKYGNDADAAIAYHYGPPMADQWIKAGRPMSMLPPDAPNYLGNVTNYAHAYGGAAPTSGSGPMAAQPPVGYTPATNAAQTAASTQMRDSYQSLSVTDANYQQSRNALTDMLALSNRQGALDKASSFLPYDWSTKVDSDAAQYAKAHSTFIAQQGSALGAGGTDQARGTIEESVPTYDKPQSARTAGLNMQLNNLDYRHLETQLMTPAFQAGDQKGYTSLNAAYHNIVKPEMMPVINTFLGLQSKGQLAAAMDYINKSYPQYKKAIDFLGTNGMFNGVGQ